MSEAFANRANVLVNHLMLVLRHGCVVFKEVVELGVLTRLLLSHCRLVLKLLQAKVLLISGALRVLLHLVNVLWSVCWSWWSHSLLVLWWSFRIGRCGVLILLLVHKCGVNWILHHLSLAGLRSVSVFLRETGIVRLFYSCVRMSMNTATRHFLYLCRGTFRKVLLNTWAVQALVKLLDGHLGISASSLAKVSILLTLRGVLRLLSKGVIQVLNLRDVLHHHLLNKLLFGLNWISCARSFTSSTCSSLASSLSSAVASMSFLALHRLW